jgi:hypothetical protein
VTIFLQAHRQRLADIHIIVDDENTEPGIYGVRHRLPFGDKTDYMASASGLVPGIYRNKDHANGNRYLNRAKSVIFRERLHFSMLGAGFAKSASEAVVQLAVWVIAGNYNLHARLTAVLDFVWISSSATLENHRHCISARCTSQVAIIQR